MYFVYLIISQNNKKIISYVGYTNNLKKRILMHNTSKGAKFTRGRNWKLIYFEEYMTKQKALKEEHKLKNNYKLRNYIKKNYIKNENFDITTL